MAAESTGRPPVLIDADNAQPSITGGLLAEAATYGTAPAEHDHPPERQRDYSGRRSAAARNRRRLNRPSPADPTPRR